MTSNPPDTNSLSAHVWKPKPEERDPLPVLDNSKHAETVIIDLDGTMMEYGGQIEGKRFMHFSYAPRPFVVVASGSRVADVKRACNDPGVSFWADAFIGCNGNEAEFMDWSKPGHEATYWQDPFRIQDRDAVNSLRWTCERLVRDSPWPDHHKTGDHFQERVGSFSFSVLGKRYGPAQREAYIEWERRTGERIRLIEQLYRHDSFEHFDYFLGGQTGIDVVRRGCHKGRIFDMLKDISGPVYAIGDGMMRYGNDRPLRDRLWLNYGRFQDAFEVSGPVEAELVLDYLAKKHSWRIHTWRKENV